MSLRSATGFIWWSDSHDREVRSYEIRQLLDHADETERADFILTTESVDDVTLAMSEYPFDSTIVSLGAKRLSSVFEFGVTVEGDPIQIDLHINSLRYIGSCLYEFCLSIWGKGESLSDYFPELPYHTLYGLSNQFSSEAWGANIGEDLARKGRQDIGFMVAREAYCGRNREKLSERFWTYTLTSPDPFAFPETLKMWRILEGVQVEGGLPGEWTRTLVSGLPFGEVVKMTGVDLGFLNE